MSIPYPISTTIRAANLDDSLSEYWQHYIGSELSDGRLTVAHAYRSHRACSTGLVTLNECFPLVGQRNARLHVG